MNRPPASGRRPTPAGQALLLLGLLAAAVACACLHSGGGLAWSPPPTDRGGAALAVLLAYALVCIVPWRTARHRRRRGTARIETGLAVIHASQTGLAEDLAGQAAQGLGEGGNAWPVVALGAIDTAALATMRRALFVVSTTGEGDAPDSAAAFSDRLMHQSPALAHLEYGLLALGDRRYTQFCAFGRALDAWLRRCGARPMFAAIEVDNGDETALAQWRQHLTVLGAAAGGDGAAGGIAEWRLVARQRLNPGSLGGAVFHLRLHPVQGDCGDQGQGWQAGDIAEVLIDRDGAAPLRREYSIASVPADGSLDLVVRQVFTPQGRIGNGSGWLTRECGIGQRLRIRLRANRGFRVDDPQAPLILIGNGTGIAGLRAHLRARLGEAGSAGQGARHWLLFGERQAAHDALFADELQQWLADGHLQRLDLAFSRDQGARVHVQHRLHAAADAVREWVAQGAIVLVCGSADGMAPGVVAVLRDILGDAGFAALQASGRYRCDIY